MSGNDAFDLWAKQNIAPTKDGFSENELPRFTPVRDQLRTAPAAPSIPLPAVPPPERPESTAYLPEGLLDVSRSETMPGAVVLFFDQPPTDAQVQRLSAAVRALLEPPPDPVPEPALDPVPEVAPPRVAEPIAPLAPAVVSEQAAEVTSAQAPEENNELGAQQDQPGGHGESGEAGDAGSSGAPAPRRKRK